MPRIDENAQPMDSATKPTISLVQLDKILNMIQGRVLTIAEAVLDGGKLKATKSLLQTAVWDDRTEVAGWVYENAEDGKNGSTFPLWGPKDTVIQRNDGSNP